MTVHGAVYYTNNRLDPRLFRVVLESLRRLTAGMEVVSVSHEPVALGRNIVVAFPSSAESVIRQIALGVRALSAQVETVHLVEHDVLYHPSHFGAVPRTPRQWLYNRNVYQVDLATGEAIFYRTRRASQLVASRELLVDWFERLVGVIEARGYDPRMGVSPACHRIVGMPGGGLREWWSEAPNLDVRHADNLTHYVYEPTHQRVDEVPYWGRTRGRMAALLDAVEEGRL